MGWVRECYTAPGPWERSDAGMQGCRDERGCFRLGQKQKPSVSEAPGDTGGSRASHRPSQVERGLTCPVAVVFWSDPFKVEADIRNLRHPLKMSRKSCDQGPRRPS